MSYQQLAIYLQDKHSISDEFEFARYAEQRGFDAIWQADTRLARDCISMMGALAAITTRVKIGSGVLPFWPRNVATLAATYSTLWEMSGPHHLRTRCVVGTDHLKGWHPAHQTVASHTRVHHRSQKTICARSCDVAFRVY